MTRRIILKNSGTSRCCDPTSPVCFRAICMCHKAVLNIIPNYSCNTVPSMMQNTLHMILIPTACPTILHPNHLLTKYSNILYEIPAPNQRLVLPTSPAASQTQSVATPATSKATHSAQSAPALPAYPRGPKSAARYSRGRANPVSMAAELR